MHAQRQHDALSALLQPTRRPDTRKPQRPAGHDHRHHDRRATVHRRRTRPHRRRHPLIRCATSSGWPPTPGHYLCVFDRHTERALYLGRAKRIASADQRIVLHGKIAAAPRPAATCQATSAGPPHRRWAEGGRTDIDDLTFACRQHHPTHQTGRMDHPENAPTAPPNGDHHPKSPPRRHQQQPPSRTTAYRRRMGPGRELDRHRPRACRDIHQVLVRSTISAANCAVAASALRRPVYSTGR